MKPISSDGNPAKRTTILWSNELLPLLRRYAHNRRLSLCAAVRMLVEQGLVREQAPKAKAAQQ